MSNSFETGREVTLPGDSLEQVTAPSDYEIAALTPGEHVPLTIDPNERDDGALATAADVRAHEVAPSDGRPTGSGMATDDLLFADVRIPIQRAPEDVSSVADTGTRDIPSDTHEIVGHVVGAGPDREITADFTHPYGHKVVALSELQARAAIEEDAQLEQSASEELAAELEAHRKDFAEWEAALSASKTDAHYEATGIVTDFNAIDRPHLPGILTSEEPTERAVLRLSTRSDSSQAEDDGQSADNSGHSVFSWLGGLSDGQLVNYFQWSEARTNEVSEALTARREEVEQHVRGVIEHLLSTGLMPEDARDGIEDGFACISIFGAMNAIESGFYQADGIYETDSKRLGVYREHSADEVEKYVHEKKNVFVHESLHAFDNANDTGLTQLLSDDEERLVWVDEAVKEHLTEAGTSGQPYILNPYERYTEGAYKDIRELLHLVLTAGDIDIDIREVMAANFERRHADEPRQAREHLVARLRESYQDLLPDMAPGETILHVIARDINAAPKPLGGQVVHDWIQKVSEWRDETLDDDYAMAGAR